MTALPSYLNVHPPADPPPLPYPPPSAHMHLLVSGSEEIRISMIMTQMKVLEMATGHNTSFSMLIKKLIGNRLVCFSRPSFFLCTMGLLWRIEKAIFQRHDRENLHLSYWCIYQFSDTPNFSPFHTSWQKHFTIWWRCLFTFLTKAPGYTVPSFMSSQFMWVRTIFPSY